MKGYTFTGANMTTQYEKDMNEIGRISFSNNLPQKEKNRLCAKIEERMYEMEQAELDGLQVGHDYYNLQLA